ncbi:hypothetical protein OAG44_01790 [bacterium]|nr:hypothetical protein [bacterium]
MKLEDLKLTTEEEVMFFDTDCGGVVHKIIRELRDTDGLSILITDHQVRETLDIVDHASLLVEGKVMIEGSSEELVNNETARKLYFGSDFRF